ncbi:hypothetical protein ACLBWT_13890 [Paenibacillus sp. D51F]
MNTRLLLTGAAGSVRKCDFDRRVQPLKAQAAAARSIQQAETRRQADWPWPASKRKHHGRRLLAEYLLIHGAFFSSAFRPAQEIAAAEKLRSF